MSDLFLLHHSNRGTQLIPILHIDPEDKKFFLDNEVKLSSEILSDAQLVLYADIGLKEEDDVTPFEIISFANVADPLKSWADLRAACETAKAKWETRDVN